jgi:hypothetical protein
LVDLKLSNDPRAALYLPPNLSLKAEGKTPNAFSLVTLEKPTVRITAGKKRNFF